MGARGIYILQEVYGQVLEEVHIATTRSATQKNVRRLRDGACHVIVKLHTKALGVKIPVSTQLLQKLMLPGQDLVHRCKDNPRNARTASRVAMPFTSL